MVVAMMHGGGGVMDGGTGEVLLVVLLVLVAVVAGAAVTWIAQSKRETGPSGPEAVPVGRGREQLDRRYASGELSRDEYLERRRDIAS